MATIEIGAHIFTPRTGYTHHGIYAGYGSVIHYSGLSDSLSAGPIEETTLEEFLGKQELSVRNYKNPKYTGQRAVDRARSRIGENNYDLQGNNCEHFCTWAVTGRPNSKQVEAVEDIVDAIIPGFVLISIIKARKHSKQGVDAADIAKDVADIGVKAALVATTPFAMPVYAVYKTIKWLFK